MEPAIHQLVQAVHDSPTRAVVVTAGAGTHALAALLGVAGASRTLLEALVPYSPTSFDEFLGQTPAQYVAGETGRLLAGRALTRARWLATESHPLVGLACTATIATDRPKRGEHRAHIATWQAERLTHYSLGLEKGARDRAGEDALVSRVMLNALAQAAGLSLQVETPLLPGDGLEVATFDFAALAARLHRGEIEYFGITADGQTHTADVVPQAVLPGAFNPLHDGHLALARVAGEILGQPVLFECAARNVDKPPLEPDVVLGRLAQFAGRYHCLASNAPTFLEKARLYPGATFVVGHDTAERILHPRYYADSLDNMLAALAEIEVLGGRFLVAGRVDERNNFQGIGDLDIPPPFAHLFQGIPERLFRRDISSTELRANGGRGSR
jgi:hypothetical protein